MSTTQPKLDEVEQSEENLQYRCPFCEVSYGNEILTRVHVMRSEDAEHLNRDGFMPETEIQIINEDGEVVGTSSKRPSEVDNESLTFEDIPDEYNDQHKAIILAGAYNPYETEYKNEDEGGLTEAAHEIMEENGLEKLTYSTVRRVLRNFYRPQEVEAKKKEKEQASQNNNEEEQLGDLTAKQQAIIIAKLANPDEGDSKIAERANNAATSYPRQVYDDRAPDVYKRLKAEVESGTDVAEAVLTELDADDVQDLVEHDYDLGVDLQGTISEAADSEDEDVFDLGVGQQKQAMSASPYGQEDEDEPAETWGSEESEGAAEADASVSELDEVEATEDSLRPAQEASTAETTDTEAESDEETVTWQDDTEEEPEEAVEAEPEAEPEVEPETETEETAAPEPTEAPEETAEASASVEGGVSRDEVEQLREKVSWFVDVTEAEMESEARDRQLAFAQQVEDDLTEILNEN